MIRQGGASRRSLSRTKASAPSISLFNINTAASGWASIIPSKGRGENRIYLGESLMRYIEDSELDEDEEAVVVIDRDVNGEEWEE